MSLHSGQLMVTWDPTNRKQIDEAKKRYIQARSQERRILAADRKAVIGKFDSGLGAFIIDEVALRPGEFSMRIYDKTGDRRLIWNSMDPNQVSEAAEEFSTYLTKGWHAYAVDKEGNKGRRIYSFDASREEIHFDDKKTLSQRLEDFVKNFSGVRMMPRTYPG